MNYDCTTHPVLPFITITTKVLSRGGAKIILIILIIIIYYNYTNPAVV